MKTLLKKKAPPSCPKQYREGRRDGSRDAHSTNHSSHFHFLLSDCFKLIGTRLDVSAPTAPDRSIPENAPLSACYLHPSSPHVEAMILAIYLAITTLTTHHIHNLPVPSAPPRKYLGVPASTTLRLLPPLHNRQAPLIVRPPPNTTTPFSHRRNHPYFERRELGCVGNQWLLSYIITFSRHLRSLLVKVQHCCFKLYIGLGRVAR